MTATTKLGRLAALAEALDAPEFRDGIAPAQLRALRNMADALAKALAEMDVPVTADTVMAVITGAHMQAQMANATNPLAALLTNVTKVTPQADGWLFAAVAMLAVDVLDGAA